MNRILPSIAHSFIRPGRVVASMFAGALLATACSERSGTVLAPVASTPPTPVAAVERASSTGGSDQTGINTGALTNGGNFTGTISVAGQTDTWTFSATAG